MVGQGLVEDFVYVYQHRDVFEIEWKLWGGNFSDKEVRKMGYHLTGVIKSIFETFFGGGAAKLLSILNKTTKGAKLVKKLSAANGKLKGKIKKIKNEAAEKAKKAKKAKEKANELKRKAAEKAKKAKEKALALKKKAKDKVTKKKSDSNDSKKVSSSDNKTKEDSDTSSDSNDDVDNDLDDESDTGDVNSNTEDNEGAGHLDDPYKIFNSRGIKTTLSSDEIALSKQLDLQMSSGGLKEFDITRYGNFNKAINRDDSLTGHELLQNAWLEANGKIPKRGVGLSLDNPAIALYENPLHKYISGQQKALRMNKANLSNVSWRTNVLDNIALMKQAGVPRNKIAELARATREFAIQNGF